MKSKLIINGIILSSILFLYGCNDDTEPLSVELPPLPAESSVGVDIDVDSNNEESEESYKSIIDYLNKNEDFNAEYKDSDIISSVSGYITQSENFDVSDELKKTWESKNHVSISRISHEYYLGFDSVIFKKNKDADSINNYYIVLKGVLYNNNNEDVSLGVLGSSNITLNNIKAIYDSEYHVSNKLVDLKNPKNVVKENSSMPIEIYYKVNTKRYNEDDINIFGDLILNNLKGTLFLQRIKYPEDLIESEKSLYDENYNLFKDLTR